MARVNGIHMLGVVRMKYTVIVRKKSFAWKNTSSSEDYVFFTLKKQGNVVLASYIEFSSIFRHSIIDRKYPYL